MLARTLNTFAPFIDNAPFVEPSAAAVDNARGPAPRGGAGDVAPISSGPHSAGRDRSPPGGPRRRAAHIVAFPASLDRRAAVRGAEASAQQTA